MAIRLFRCTDCGHRMRLGGRYCGACHAHKTNAQLRARWLVPLLAFAVAVLLLAGTVRLGV